MLDRFLRPSTQAFLHESRKTRGFRWLDVLHGYIYMRWPYFYISVATGEHPLARAIGPVASLFWKKSPGPRQRETVPSERSTFADTYHGKVVPLSGATELVTVGKEIAATLSEKVLPYSRARDIVLKNPDHIVALDCPCRSARTHPCLPLGVCLVVGEPFASFTLQHHPGRSRAITQAEAVEILKSEDARGHVHHAFLKDAMLGRFYAICNCCSCCCGAIQAHRNGVPMLASSGYVCTVNPSACAGCAECVQYCQFGALGVEDGLNHVNEGTCMGCGVCVDRCRRHALALVRDPSRGEPLSVCELETGSLLSAS